MIRFTKDEKIALLFLLFCFLVGTTVLYCKKTNPSFVSAIRLYESGKKDAEKININTATILELTELKGVGPVLAARVVSYRKKNGPFRYPSGKQATITNTFVQSTPWN